MLSITSKVFMRVAMPVSSFHQKDFGLVNTSKKCLRIVSEPSL